MQQKKTQKKERYKTKTNIDKKQTKKKENLNLKKT